MDDVENKEASGSGTSRPLAAPATHTLVLSSLLCLVLVLIAESWQERGEGQCRAGLRTKRWEENGDPAKVREPVAH